MARSSAYDELLESGPRPKTELASSVTARDASRGVSTVRITATGGDGARGCGQAGVTPVSYVSGVHDDVNVAAAFLEANPDFGSSLRSAHQSLVQNTSLSAEACREAIIRSRGMDAWRDAYPSAQPGGSAGGTPLSCFLKEHDGAKDAMAAYREERA